MVWVQSTTPKPNRRQEFALNDFSGGLNNRALLIEDNEASKLLNMRFLQDNVLEKRTGFQPFDALILNAPITYMGIFKPYTSADELIRATNSNVYINQVNVANVLGEIDAINYQGRFFFCDGDKIRAYGKFTSTTSTYVQIVGTQPIGNVVLTVINPPTNFVPLDETHVRGVTIYNYTNLTVHYEPCVFELNDPYLGANVLPEHPRFIVAHKGRVFISGDKEDDDNVFMSHVTNPFYFSVALPLQLPPNSDNVTSLVVYGDNVIVSRKNDIYRISGETSNPALGFELFSLRKLNTHTGITNNKCASMVHNFLFFLGSDGIAYALSPGYSNTELLSTQIISNKIDIFKAPINATYDGIDSASSFFDDDNWYINIVDKTLVYSYRHQAWTVFDQVDMNASLVYNNELIWGRKDGRVAKFSTDYLDDGYKPIYAYWESKLFTMDNNSKYKQFREFYLVAHAFDDMDSEIRVAFEIDYADVKNSAIIENKIAIFGKSVYGDRFIDRNINASIPFMIGRRARHMRIKFSSGYEVIGTVNDVLSLDAVSIKLNYLTYFVTSVNAYYYYLDGVWIALSDNDIKQPMRVYEVNGEYELKGKR